MSQVYFYPPSIASNPSIGTNGVTAPTSSTEVGGINNSGNLTPLSLDASGALIVTPASGSTGNVNLTQVSGVAITLGQKAMAASLPITIASDQSALPVSQSGTWNITNVSGTVSLPTGASTSALQTTGNTSLSTIATNTGNLSLSQGSTTSGQAGNLVLTATTTAAPTYTTGQSNPLSTTTTGALRVDASGSTQPVSGTVTVNQGTSPWVENVSQFGGSNVVTGTGTSGAGIPRVTVSSDSSLTNISGTISLPTGAATSANQTNASQKTQIVDGSGNVIASTTNALNVNVQNSSLSTTTTETVNGATGLSIADVGFLQANAPVYNDYTGTSITTAAYVTLIASTTATTREIEIFDSSGQALYLATGAAASEINQMIIFPGGNGRVKLSIPSGTRVSAKAITANAVVGFLAINLYG